MPPSITILDNTGGYTDPEAGYYTGISGMWVTAYADEGWHFVEWDKNGVYYSSNPAIYVTYDNTVQPVFELDEPPPTHWLYLDAYDTNWWEEWHPAVYVDDNFVGYAPVAVQITEGWHSITVDEWIGMLYLSGFSDELGNGDSRLINSDTYITAYYTLAGK